MPRRYQIGIVVLVIIGIVIIRHVASPSGAEPADTSGTSHVKVETVANLSSEAGPLQVVGSVTSLNRATILAQTSGEIVYLGNSAGDHVYAGSVIGQFENSSQRAAVTQAEGAYDAAAAALAKATSTTAANSGISSSQAETAATNAASSLATALHVAFAALDNAIRTRADVLFIDPQGAKPTLQPFVVPDAQLVINIQNERLKLNDVLKDAEQAALPGTNVDIVSRTASILNDSQQVILFLNNLLAALNQAVGSGDISASTIATYQTSVGTARTEVVSAVSSVTTAKGAYDAAIANAETAANSANLGTQNDVAAAQAALKSAQGSLDAARSNLEKTIIRSPISGTIVSLPVTQGDYVSAYSPVAVVSNPSALYVDTRVTPDDAKTLTVGGEAVISGSTRGVITFISPAIDPLTGKIEVKVGVRDEKSALTDGESVTVALSRTRGIPSSGGQAQITVPIKALKISPEGPLVFTVSTSSTLTAHPVTVGSILGDRVIVLSGLLLDMHIVTDARGLSSGETVIVDAEASSTAP